MPTEFSSPDSRKQPGGPFQLLQLENFSDALPGRWTVSAAVSTLMHNGCAALS